MNATPTKKAKIEAATALIGRFSRRELLIGTLGLAVAGCGKNRLGKNLAVALEWGTTGLPGPDITRDRIDKIPFATIAARIGKGPRSILVLWRTDGANLHWLSADGAAIITRNGRVVKTVGLPTNLSDTRDISVDPLSPSQIGIIDGATYKYTRDRAGELEFGLEVESRFRVLGAETIRIAEIEFDTIHVVEDCLAKTQNWRFRNEYWLDPADGFVWQSDQVVLPEFSSFKIETLKPASPA